MVLLDAINFKNLFAVISFGSSFSLWKENTFSMLTHFKNLKIVKMA